MSAKTANNQLNKKNAEVLHLMPVKLGETIFQNTIVGVSVDGYVYDLDAAIIPSVIIAGIVADNSANTTPAATTAEGSVSGDRASADAGDKTCRQIWLRGRFLLDFTDTLTQADVGKVAYAANNNDCNVSGVAGVAIGTIVAFVSASLAWVELNVFMANDRITIKQAVAGSTSTAVGGLFSIDNPFGAKAILEEVVLDITTASTGGATADIGVGTSSSVDNLFDGLVLNGAVTGIKTPVPDAGTNGGKIPKGMASTDKVVATASASTAGLVGVVSAIFRRWA